jgi:hypothetical protein
MVLIGGGSENVEVIDPKLLPLTICNEVHTKLELLAVQSSLGCQDIVTGD